jgi:hypothetical protein
MPRKVVELLKNELGYNPRIGLCEILEYTPTTDRYYVLPVFPRGSYPVDVDPENLEFITYSDDVFYR